MMEGIPKCGKQLDIFKKCVIVSDIFEGIGMEYVMSEVLERKISLNLQIGLTKGSIPVGATGPY